jgi:Putative Ig domain
VCACSLVSLAFRLAGAYAVTSFRYEDNPLTLSVGTDSGSTLPVYDGINADPWSVQPSLPLGLSLNQVTGEISGTPTSYQGQQAYTVFVGPIVSYQLILTVNDVQPSFNEYSSMSNAGNTLSNAETTTSYGYRSFKPLIATYFEIPAPVLTVNSHTFVGGITFTVSPPLPSGVTLAADGRIYGTPDEETLTVLHEVTITSTGGSSSLKFKLEIVDLATKPIEVSVAEARDDAKTAVDVAFITLGALFFFAIIALLTFLAWRSRASQGPPVILSHDAMEKIRRQVNAGSVTMRGVGLSTSRSGANNKLQSSMSTGGMSQSSNYARAFTHARTGDPASAAAAGRRPSDVDLKENADELNMSLTALLDQLNINDDEIGELADLTHAADLMYVSQKELRANVRDPHTRHLIMEWIKAAKE